MSFVYDMDYKFEDCMGNIYFRIIKENIPNFQEIKNVVEFAPGFRYKIACGLKKINFKGNIYIIDLNKNVLKYVYEKYKEILPEANIICIEYTLKDSIKKLPINIDLFLSNHCIDDMIIGEFIGNENIDFAFGNNDDSKEYLIKKWSELANATEKLEKIKEVVYKELIYFIENASVKYYIMSQYKSAYYIKEKSTVENNAIEIFNRLKNKFIINKKNLKNAMDFYIEDFDEASEYEELSFKNNIQNIENWIVGMNNKI